MARTVNPQQHAAQRLRIIDAAMTCFAAEGFERATTAAICRQAGIGSGTFFHYFPTKVDVLLAVLEMGTDQVRARFAAHAEDDPKAAILDWAGSLVDDLRDPRAPTFVAAVGAVMSQPRVRDAITADEQAQRDGLLPLVEAAARRGDIRTDLPPRDVVAWLMLLTDGFTGRLAAEPAFTVDTQRATLLDTVERFLAPSPAGAEGHTGSAPADG